MFLLIFLISCRLIFLDPRTWVASTLRPTGPLRKNSVDRQTCEASRIFYLWCCRGRWSLEGHLRPPLQYTLFLKRKSRVNSVALGGSCFFLSTKRRMTERRSNAETIWDDSINMTLFCWVGIPVVTNAESLPFWQFRSVQVASRWKGSRTCDFSQDGLLSPRVQNCIFVWFFYFYYYFSATRYMHWHVSPLPCNQPEFFSFFSLSLSASTPGMCWRHYPTMCSAGSYTAFPADVWRASRGKRKGRKAGKQSSTLLKRVESLELT